MGKLKKRKDGRFQTSVYVKKPDGTHKTVVVYGKTQKECKAKAAALKSQVHKGIDVSSAKKTWGDWVSDWRSSMSLIKSERQQVDDGYYLKHFERLNSVPLERLQISDFQNIINQLYKMNPRTKKPTAKKTLIKIKCVANQVFKHAIQNRATDFNPAEFIQIPVDAPQAHRRSLTEEEVYWVEHHKHRAQLPAMIMLYSGLRPSECFALQWKDIDLVNKTIDVNKTLKMKEKHPYTVPKTKTDDGLRLVDIPNKLVAFLKPLKRGPFDFVCVNTKGEPYTESCWNSLWDSYMFSLNYEYGDFSLYINKPKSKYQPSKIPMVIEGFSPYYLRHTHATDLFDAGCNIFYVKNQMGHRDVKTTLGIYVHFTKRNKSANSSKLDEMLENVESKNYSQIYSQATEKMA